MSRRAALAVMALAAMPGLHGIPIPEPRKGTIPNPDRKNKADKKRAKRAKRAARNQQAAK
jgi:hypothetical protein